MASPHAGRLSVTPSSVQRLSLTPGSRVLQSPPGDETIWKRLKEAGFDEESIKRRDKAALIAYIAKLEAEIFDHQHQMGLLLLEKKELASKFEQIKASADAVELKHKRDQAVHVSALAEARKREESLKKALGVEKECIASIEKTLHELRAESAETKVAAQNKLIEARNMTEDAQNKLIDAESKLRAAETLESDASRYRHFAERKLQEVEAREDDLRRRILSFNSECDAKESEILLERKSLGERQTVLHQGEKRLLEGQALLSQREEYIMSRSEELARSEKQIEDAKAELEKLHRALNDERSALDLRSASLSEREQACIFREASLNKKEQEVLILQEKISSRESNEIQKAIASHEAGLRSRKSELEAELEKMRKIIDGEIETKRRAWELRELDLCQREDQLKDREHEVEIQFGALVEREKDVSEKLADVEKREKGVTVAEQELKSKNILLQKEKEEICKLKQDLRSSVDMLEDKKKQVDNAQDKLEAMKTETDELSVLEIKLKEELDRVRAEKLEVMAEADKLKNEKAKFEAEWESIDEKREELRKEAERIAEERMAVSKFLKEERDGLRIEKEAIRDQYKRDAELLRAEREKFMSKISQEHSEWFNKIHQERTDFLKEIELQKMELENCIDKRREELESSLREKEKAFEQEKKNELQYINSLKESNRKEMERIDSEMRQLEIERMEVNLDRERREKEWAELNNSIEELRLQREKLTRQRELLHADRQEIQRHIEQLNQLEELNIASEKMAVAAMQQSALESSLQKISDQRFRKQRASFANNDSNVSGLGPTLMQETSHASPSSARFSWIKKATDLIFKSSSEKSTLVYRDESPTSELDKSAIPSGIQLVLSMEHERKSENIEVLNGNLSEKNAVGEEKTIFEVPTLDEDAMEIRTLEPESKEDDAELPAHITRKRGNDLLSTDSVDNVQESRQNKKKRGDLGEAAVNQSEASDTNRANSGLLDAPDSLPVSQACSEGQITVEETTVLIVEEVPTMASETIDHEKSRAAASEDHQHNPLYKSAEDANFSQLVDDVPPLRDPVAQKILQAQLESVGLVTREDQLEDVSTDNGGEFGDQDNVK